MNIIKNYAIAAFILSSLGGSSSYAEGLKSQLVGTWIVVSNVETWDDGKKVEWGPDLRGRLTLDAAGHYSFQMGVGDRPKGTGNPAEEPKGRYVGYVGNYEVNDGDNMLLLKVELCSSPNLEGSVQKRKIVSVSNSELVYTAAEPIKAGSRSITPVLTFKKLN